MSRQRTRLLMVAAVVMGVLGLAVTSCKKQAAAPAAASDDLLMAALETQGGAAKFKAGSAFTARYEGTLMGTTIKGSVKHLAGAVRLEYMAPCGDPVSQVMADGKCWQRIGKVVLPCADELREHTTRLSRLLEASWLWPLKENKDRTVKTEKVQVAGKSYDGLTISSGGVLVGTLLFDPETTLVAGLKMQTTLMGKTGELLGFFTDYETNCGIKFATKRQYTFDGKKIMTEKLGGLICEAVDRKLFERPAQVKHGEIVLKHKASRIVACTKIKGSLSGVPAAMKQVAAYLEEKGLAQQGAPVLVHRKGSPRVKRPAGFVTDVCLTVGKKSWLLPPKTWKGTFTLHEILGDEVLAGFGVGELEKVSIEIPDLLVKDGKQRGRKQVGQAIQILYMPPGSTPDAERVSEFHIVLN